MCIFDRRNKNNDKRKKIPISAGVFIFDKDKLNYVYGGTYNMVVHIKNICL